MAAFKGSEFLVTGGVQLWPLGPCWDVAKETQATGGGWVAFSSPRNQ